MVTTGYPRQKRTDIIDLKKAENSCQQGDEFPILVSSATGGLVRENVPFICGGYDNSGNARKECYWLTDHGFENVINMTEPKFASSSVIQNQDLLVFGGRYSNYDHISSIERVSVAKQSSTVIGEMPFKFSYGCVLTYEEKKLIAIAGYQNGIRSDKTWTSSFDNLAKWTQGPNLFKKRSSLGCAIFHHFKMAIVVGGYDGSSYSSTTELIQLNENKVVKGKK